MRFPFWIWVHDTASIGALAVRLEFHRRVDHPVICLFGRLVQPAPHWTVAEMASERSFAARTRMKLFCYLPGCAKIEEESLRRVYVWVMVPLLGIILLGIESGLSVSTAAYIFGSFFSAIIALLPHGLIEIPTLALAGAVTYSAHLLVKEQARRNMTRVVFQQIEAHRKPCRSIKIAFIGDRRSVRRGMGRSACHPRILANTWSILCLLNPSSPRRTESTFFPRSERGEND
jgi:hypothetical protein